MGQSAQPSILVGDRVRSYALPGRSDRDWVTGIVVGFCLIAGLPRVIIESESRVTLGQEDPCIRVFRLPLEGMVKVGSPGRRHLMLHRVA